MAMPVGSAFRAIAVGSQTRPSLHISQKHQILRAFTNSGHPSGEATLPLLAHVIDLLTILESLQQEYDDANTAASRRAVTARIAAISEQLHVFTRDLTGQPAACRPAAQGRTRPEDPEDDDAAESAPAAKRAHTSGTSSAPTDSTEPGPSHHLSSTQPTRFANAVLPDIIRWLMYHDVRLAD
jgi:hypothetical protein